MGVFRTILVYRNLQSVSIRKHFLRQALCLMAGVMIYALFLSEFSVTASATTIKEQNIIANQAVTVETNEVENWPEGPTVSAESAILMELDTGVILYEKNIHAHEYPASTTKILTTLIASEECSLDEIVTFSADAVFGIPSDSNHVAMDVGDTLTMQKCLEAILIRSANEVSYAVAEHISGTWDAFADKMNERAEELGCVDSHFVNPNGLPDENHYTSAYDLAMIGRAFFSNELLCQITLMRQLHIEKEDGDLYDNNTMELIPGGDYEYEYLVGCKTGYTDAARSCLVSCAEKDGMKLICVVLKDESPYQYEDTIALFNYGFSNFEKVNVSETETKYNIESSGFYSDNDIFGSSKPILSLNTEDCVILPKTLDFDELTSEISYDTTQEDQAAVIRYSYEGRELGTASVDLAVSDREGYTFEAIEQEPEEETEQTSFIFINVIKVLGILVGAAALGGLLFLLIRFLRSYHFRHPSNRRAWKRERRRHRSFYQDRRRALRKQRRDALKHARRHERAARRNRGRF